jgi:hypothetical protein
MVGLTVTIFQPSPFSTLNIYARAAQSDAVILLTTAQFTATSPDKDGTKKITGMKHIHLGGNQQPDWLALSVGKELQPLCDTPLGKGDWRSKLLSQITFRYKSAPYFEETIESVTRIMEKDTSLGDLSETSFRWAHRNLALWSHIYKDTDFAPKQRDKGGWILDLCKEIGATRMITGAPSLNYMNHQEWADAGIKLVAQDWKCATYKQHKYNWTPNLSVLDSIFYQGWEATRNLISTNND